MKKKTKNEKTNEKIDKRKKKRGQNGVPPETAQKIDFLHMSFNRKS